MAPLYHLLRGNMKKILSIAAAVVLISIVFFTYIAARTNLAEGLPQQVANTGGSNFNIANYLVQKNIAAPNLLQDFPYETYLDSTNTRNIRVIKNDLALLESFSNDVSTSQQIVSEALTTKLEPRLVNYLHPYNPDSLLVLVQWAEKFQHYAEIDPANDILHESIYNYWMDKVSNQLGKFSAEESSRKYDYKFKYLRSRCIEKRFVPAIKVTSEEKAFNNLVYGNYGHLLNASWNQTSILQKAVFVILVLLTLYGYICIIKQHVNKKR